MASTYQGRHWATNVNTEPSLFRLFLTTFIPGYIYDLQVNRNNFRIKWGYIPLTIVLSVIGILVFREIQWHDLMMSLALKKYSVG